MLPCSNSEAARPASISFSWAGEPPRRGPLEGLGIVLLLWAWRGRPPYGTDRHLSSRLALLGLAEVLTVVFVLFGLGALLGPEGRGGLGRVEGAGRVLQAQAHAGELHLHFVY